jgi:PPOX class probable F420-dependent enzyme
VAVTTASQKEVDMGMHAAYRTGSGLTEWAEEVLARRVYAVIATLNDDGSPHTTPVGFLFDGDRFLIQSGARSRKVRNIEREPRVRVLVQAPAQVMGEDGWVAADGLAHVVHGEESRHLNEAANSRYLTEEGKAIYEEAIGPIMDVTLVVVPDRWQTWTDSSMFRPLLDRGYTEDEIARWFLEAES